MKKPRVLGSYVLATKIDKPVDQKNVLIVLERSNSSEPQEYLVISVGADVKEINVGDIILTNPWSAKPFPVNGVEYLLVHTEHVMAVMEDSELDSNK